MGSLGRAMGEGVVHWLDPQDKAPIQITEDTLRD